MAERGRPTNYRPEYAAQAEKLCNLGATDIEIADFFEVALRTIGNWKHEHPDFLAALKTGKDALDERVERSLYHRAIGYTFDSIKFVRYENGVEQIPYREHVPPDVVACIFWLKNRRFRQWNDVNKHEVGKAGAFDKMNADELADYIRSETQVLGLGDAKDAVSTGDGKARDKLN
jgi:hypothetical protein